MMVDQAIEYVIESRNINIELMNDSQDWEQFYLYKGKVLAYNEILRVLQND